MDELLVPFDGESKQILETIIIRSLLGIVYLGKSSIETNFVSNPSRILSWDQTEAGSELAITAANAGLEDIIFDSMMQSISLAPVGTNCIVNSASKKNCNRVCYPVYDKRIAITLRSSELLGQKSSRLDANGTILRPLKLLTGMLASASFGVTIFH